MAAAFNAGVHLGHCVCVFLGLVLAKHARRSWKIAPLAGAAVQHFEFCTDQLRRELGMAPAHESAGR